MSSAEIARTVKTLFSPGDVIELRTFKDGTYSGYFNDHDKLVKAAVQHDERGHDVYITLNKLPKDLVYRRYNKIERSKPKDASTADKDIDRRNYLFIDADCERVSGISSTDAEKEKSRLKVAEISAHLAAWDWGSPIVCDSGNGYHLLYPIDLPADEDALKLVSGVLESLDFKFSDEAVKVDTTTKDAARITKCYGTVAKKGENQPDRPHRASKILTVPEVLTPVSPQQLEAVAATKPEEPQLKGRGAIVPKAYKDFDMGEWIAEHDIPVKFDAPWQGGHKWILKECLNGHTDNAGYLIQMPSGAKVARCHHNSCTYEWPDYYEHFDPDAYSLNGFRAKGDGNDSNDSDSKGFAGVLADMPEPVEFPTDTMPESVRPFIRETAASIGCPVDFVGLSALVAQAAMGDTRRIVIKREWLESATLFGMNIGEPGSKKTPAMNAPFRPVREKQMKYKSEYERQKEEYKSQLVNYQKAVKEGPTELSEPDKPTLRRTYGDDTTVERLADVLNENPRGVVIIKDELSGWLGSMNQYKAGGKGSDRQFWLSVHTN